MKLVKYCENCVEYPEYLGKTVKLLVVLVFSPI